MNLKQLLLQVFKNYPSFFERRKSFPSRTLTRSIPLKKSDRPMIRKVIGNNVLGSLQINCSCGEGKWASVPWITIYDAQQYDKHPSAERGIYLVYLFSDDLQHVYLSLNMGATQFANKYGHGSITKKVLKIMNGYAGSLRKNLLKLYNHKNSNIYARLIDHPILLKKIDQDRSYRLLGYEAGNVYGLRYSSSDIKNSDNSNLISDLKTMISIYKLLMDHGLQDLSFQSNTKQVLHDLNLNKYSISHMNLKMGNVRLRIESNKVNESKSLDNKKDTHPVGTEDTLSKSERLSYLGDNGEKAVVKYEKRRLEKNGRSDLAKKVHQVSATKARKGNNHLGYDVLSFNLDNSKLHIEVKTTTSKRTHQPIPISDNELKLASSFDGHDSKHMPKNYRLYRIYKAEINKKNELPFVSYTPQDLMKAYHKKSYQIISYRLYI